MTAPADVLAVVRMLLDGYRPSQDLARWVHPVSPHADRPMPAEHAHVISAARRT